MYVRKVGDQVLTFQVSGKLWMRSLVMSDVETKTEWAHLLGRGMAGELKGKTLQPLITDMVTWSAWRKQYPNTTVLDMNRTSKNYTRKYYRDPAKFVFGFELDGKAWALPMQKIMDNPVHPFEIEGHSLLATFDTEGAVTRLFEVSVDGQSLTFAQVDEKTMKDEQTKSVWKIATGEAIGGPMNGKLLKQRVGIMSYRRAWKNFHPESRDVGF